MKVFRVVEKRGFDQAIDLSLEILSNVKFVQETRLIGKSWKKSFRIVESLCMAWRMPWRVWGSGKISLDINRYVLKNTKMNEIIIKHLNREQEADQSNFQDSITSSTSRYKTKSFFWNGLRMCTSHSVAHLRLSQIIQRKISFL